MARDERFKKVSGAGADFLEAARARAEEFLKELSKAGGDTQGRAHEAVDDLVQGGRTGTEQLVNSIRHEVRRQLEALGLATKEDLADLERRLTGQATAAKKAAAKKAAPAKKAAAKKAAPAKKTAG